MKKVIILAALALLVGIYSFQKNDPEVSAPSEEEGTAVKKIKRKIASLPSHPSMNHEAASITQDGQTYFQDNEPINCLNYDGDDICQNDYASQETFPEETYTSSDSEIVQSEGAVPEMEESAPVEFENDAAENHLFAANPATQE